MATPAPAPARGSPTRFAALAALVVVAWGIAVWFAVHGSKAVDLGVYRTAVSVWRHGMPLYAPAYPYGLGVRLPFTYPPFALLPFSVLAAVPMWAALTIVIALGLLAVVGATRLAWGSAWSATTAGAWWSRPAPAVLATLAVSAAFEPVISTLSFGQVNLILMGLVAADALLPRTPWPRGLLVGLCAALKLTPLAFLLLFLCRRDWRAAGWTVLSFLLATGVGALVRPQDSATYWFTVLRNSDRVGSVVFTANQSLRAVIFRFGPEPTMGLVLWLVAEVVVLGAAVVGVRARLRQGDDLGALVVTAATGLLASPISWNHHYVWCLPALVWLVRRALALPAAGRARTAPWVVMALTVVVFVVGPSRFLPNGDGRELAWVWWQHLVGAAYVWAACALVGWAAYDGWRRRSPQGGVAAPARRGSAVG